MSAGEPRTSTGGARTSAGKGSFRDELFGRTRWAVQELWTGQQLGVGTRAALAALAPL